MRAHFQAPTYAIGAEAAGRCQVSAFGTFYHKPFLVQLNPRSHKSVLEYTRSNIIMDQADEGHCQVLGLGIGHLAGSRPEFLLAFMVIATLDLGLGIETGRSERTEAC